MKAMLPTKPKRLARMGACRWDLGANGIDVTRKDARALRSLAETHLEYFQLMLGYDATTREIVTLMNSVAKRPRPRSNGRAKRHPRT